jgi:LuxR family maltose regulon positive regulatory protein
MLSPEVRGERALRELEEANAFVVSVDAARSWFRYHRLFADLLQLELRSAEPGRLMALHGAAAGWYAGHGYPVEAVRHAQAAEDWALAGRLLSDHWPGLFLSGRGATVGGLLARFPSGAVAADPELTVVRAADELVRGSAEEAGRQLALAAGALASVPAGRRERVRVLLGVQRVLVARRRMDVPVVVGEAQRLLASAAAADAARFGLGEDVRAAALICLGTAEIWALRFEDAGRHLEQAVALARRMGRPYLEFMALGALGARVAAVPARGAAAAAGQAGDRAGGTERLGRGPARRDRLYRPGRRNALPGAAGRSRALARAR